MKTLGWLLLVLALGFPAALVLTFATWNFWGWFEAKTGIESLGHSGPADWCFWFVYGLCVGATGIIAVWRRRRRARVSRGHETDQH